MLGIEHIANMEKRIVILTLICAAVSGQTPETFKASQCFKSLGIPKVSFSCPPDNMIKISKAFHGIAVDDRKTMDPTSECVPSPGLDYTNCTFCRNDCIDDSMNLVYDWSTCMGNTSCVRTVMQSFMPDCQGPDKFSDYLQVEYQCIPRPSVINICSNLEEQWKSKGGFLMSPNYPDHYPTNQDCMCTLTTDTNSKIVLSFYDLLLETKKGRCRADWLMLRQNEQKHRHCGAIMTGIKNITSAGNSVQLQFHSDKNNNVTQTFQYFTRILKGFWLYFSAVPQSAIQINCNILGTDAQAVQEIWLDDSDYDELINIKETLDLDKTTNDASDNKDMMTKDDMDMKDKNMKTKEPKGNDVLKKNDVKFGQENEIDFQGGRVSHKSGSVTTVASAGGVMSVVIMAILH